MRYYIADSHFFHGNLNTKMDHRGFESMEAMNQYILKQWNSRFRKARKEFFPASSPPAI